ncbi:MAG: GNAT family N-acetyltransferase [Candidatus Odinarchaeota archaeon]
MTEARTADQETYEKTLATIFENSLFYKYGLLPFKTDGSTGRYIARVNGELAGLFAYTFTGENEITIDHVGLLPEYRNKGLGSPLLQASLELLARKGFSGTVIVEFLLDDVTLFNFYIKGGFTVSKAVVMHYGKEGGMNFEGTPFEFLEFTRDNQVHHFIPWIYMQKKI